MMNRRPRRFFGDTGFQPDPRRWRDTWATKKFILIYAGNPVILRLNL
jgi:hypothetical protein